MDIQLEHLQLIPKILEALENIKQNLSIDNQKRWLNVAELAEYLGYSKDRIYKIKEEHFIEGVHFHKKIGKLLFDRVAIDGFVSGKERNDTNKQKRYVVDNILSSIPTLPSKSET